MSRRPDYILGMMDRETGSRDSNIGAVWVNDDGTLSLTLKEGITLTGSKRTSFKLFPRDSKPPGALARLMSFASEIL